MKYCLKKSAQNHGNYRVERVKKQIKDISKTFKNTHKQMDQNKHAQKIMNVRCNNIYIDIIIT